MRALNSVSLIAVFFLITAMGGRMPTPSSPSPSGPNIAPVQTLYQSFKALGVTYGAVFISDNISFSFRSFFGSVVGMCTSSSNQYNKVEISPSAFNSGSAAFREMLVFHELGHCALGRGHDNKNYSDGRPESLMNSWLFDPRTYTANRDAYLKELFTVTNNARAVSSLASHSVDEGGCSFSKNRAQQSYR